MDWLYIWAGSLAEGNTDGNLMLYGFSVTDAYGTPTSDAGDSLVYVMMEQGDDLSWASVIVQIAVDAGPFTECTNPDNAVGTGCALSDNDDGKWGFGEEITISEGSADLCDMPCEVVVKVIDRAENKLIYESSSTYAE